MKISSRYKIINNFLLISTFQTHFILELTFSLRLIPYWTMLSHNDYSMSSKISTKRLDYLVLIILAIGAGCGLIYEYLLSHYAARVLGSVEESIFAIISIMMFFFGIGAFLARFIKNPFAGFAWIEVILALVGSTSVLLIGAVFALVSLFPRLIAETFGLPADLIPIGGFIESLVIFAKASPYIMAAILGVLIGLEIPLIAEIRTHIYKDKTIHNNMGSIYGIDYIGAGLGSLLWIFFILSMDVTLAGALTATANLVIGFVFFLLFKEKIPSRGFLMMTHVLVAVIILQVYSNGSNWSAKMEDMLYQDKVVYSSNTKYQHLVITERYTDTLKPSILTFYINGRTQFASNDEHIYHSMLTYPALMASARQDKILVIGGGDGLALRDILRWKPEQIVLLDLDEKLIELFKTPQFKDGKQVNQRLIQANQNAFNDPRIKLLIGDAFLNIDQLIKDNKIFDSIIIDLPDPSHPNLNKLFSSRFYSKLLSLLAGDGAMVVQSTSPFHAKNTFMSIGKTVKFAGFAHVQQYHQNVPSFGEWGFTIATKNGLSARQRLKQYLNQHKKLPIDDGWITAGLLLASFEFHQNFYQDYDSIKINRIGSMTAYQYHRDDWQKRMGLYIPKQPEIQFSASPKNDSSALYK